MHNLYTDISTIYISFRNLYSASSFWFFQSMITPVGMEEVIKKRLKLMKILLFSFFVLFICFIAISSGFNLVLLPHTSLFACSSVDCSGGMRVKKLEYLSHPNDTHHIGINKSEWNKPNWYLFSHSSWLIKWELSILQTMDSTGVVCLYQHGKGNAKSRIKNCILFVSWTE